MGLNASKPYRTDPADRTLDTFTKEWPFQVAATTFVVSTVLAVLMRRPPAF